MALFDLIVLAVIQGITEFLPISSSGHLALWPLLTGRPDQGQVLDIGVHLGTLVAVCLYFRADLARLFAGAGHILTGRFRTPEARLAWLLALATVPAVVAGLAAQWLRPRMAEGNEGNPPRTEVVALAARVCSRRERYPALPEGCRDWALRRLALRPETRPDWLIPGLRAWQARLEPGGSAP